ncbi:hypothetical protein UT300016_08080 [Clostridium senegalense]
MKFLFSKDEYSNSKNFFLLLYKYNKYREENKILIMNMYENMLKISPVIGEQIIIKYKNTKKLVSNIKKVLLSLINFKKFI